jgi:hypothetical protein
MFFKTHSLSLVDLCNDCIKEEGFQRRCGVYNRQISVGLFLKKSFKTLPRLLSNCKKNHNLIFYGIYAFLVCLIKFSKTFRIKKVTFQRNSRLAVTEKRTRLSFGRAMTDTTPTCKENQKL